MKLLIPIDQRASIAAGHDAPNSTETFDLPASLIPDDIRGYIAAQYDPAKGGLKPYASLGYFSRDLQYANSGGERMPLLAHPVTTESVLGWLREYYDTHYARYTEAATEAQQRKEQQAAAEAARAEQDRLHRIAEDAAIDAFLADPVARGESWNCRVPATGDIRDDGRWISVPSTNSRRADVLAEIERRNTADAEAKSAAEAELAAAKKAFTRAFLIERGTPDQVERFDAGVLAESEYIGTMKDAAFALVSDLPRYQKITKSEVVELAVERGDVEEYAASELAAKYDTEPTKTVSAEAWAVGKRIQAAIPNAKIEHVMHQGTLDSRDVPWYDMRPAIKATVQYGPFVFSREFAA